MVSYERLGGCKVLRIEKFLGSISIEPKISCREQVLTKDALCNCNEFSNMCWQCTQPKNVAHNVHALKIQHSSKSSKILYEICRQPDAQSDINNLSDGSLSSFSSFNNKIDNNDAKQTIVNVLHLSTLKEDGHEEEYQSKNDSLYKNSFTVFNCWTNPDSRTTTS